MNNYPKTINYPSTRKSKHGGHKTLVYYAWSSMKSRCYNKNHEKYPYYGARGITVCQAWIDSFAEFKSWALSNGYQKGLQLDRIDNNKNYEPGNCRWTTPEIQQRNRRNARLITMFGETKHRIDWMKDPRRKVTWNSFEKRVKTGWGLEQAFSTSRIDHIKRKDRDAIHRNNTDP